MVEGDIASQVSGYASGALNIGVVIVIIFVVLGFLVAMFFMTRYVKRYKQFRIIIFSKDSFGQVQEEYDEGGIFVDKQTKNKRLYLRKNNVGLEPDSIPYVSNRKGKRKIYLYKTGLKNFRYVIPNIDEEGNLTFNNVGEEDVNWAINAYERAKKNFATSLLMQYLPFFVLAFVSIIILIMFMYFFQQFSVLKDVALALKEAAQATSGTTVIPA